MAERPKLRYRWYIPWPLGPINDITAAEAWPEFCYNVKYVARNGRPQRNPWSIRQTGIYERHNLHTGESVWIILEPSERAHRRLKEATTSRHLSGGKTRATCMALHAAILIASGREWGEYLEDLRGQMQQLVRV